MVRLTVSRCLIPALLLAAVPAASQAAGPATSRKAQMQFGVDMARRGLWSEALFRFEAARKLEPNDAAVLNNLAICYEAAGRFDDALATYRAALAVNPGNRSLKQNYSRFAEFFQDFKPTSVAAPAAAAPGVGPAPVEPAPAATEAPPETPAAPVEPATPPAAPVGGSR